MKKRLALALSVLLLFQVGCSAAPIETNSSTSEKPEAIQIESPTQTVPTPAKSDTPIEEISLPHEYVVEANGYSICTSNVYASAAGAAVLENGGNAVDAAITAAYVLNVVEPYASGIGGGGGMLIYSPEDESITFLNYFSESGISGARGSAVAVPGFVSGMETAREKFGTLSREELIAPAISYARDGFTAGAEFAYRIQVGIALYQYLQNMSQYREGSLVVQPELADTLQMIAEKGQDGFYTGEYAAQISEATGLALSDLESYETLVSEPISASFQGYQVYSAPAPFSGITLLQMLRYLELHDTPSPDLDRNAYLTDLVYAKVGAARYRNKYICDNRFHWKNYDYNKGLTDNTVLNMLSLGQAEDDEESEDTTHISVVDKDGMAVSMTNTLSQFWGSGICIGGAFFNNTMSNFTSGINAWEPGKRPRTYIAPTILLGDDGTVISIGSPGGSKIPVVLSTVLFDILKFGTDEQVAINKRRIYVGTTQQLYIEASMGDFGMQVDPYGSDYFVASYRHDKYFGCVSLAAYSPEKGFFTVSDPRREGFGIMANLQMPTE